MPDQTPAGPQSIGTTAIRTADATDAAAIVATAG